MRAPLSWIKEFVEIPASLTAEEISDALIRVGFEVEEIIKQGSDLTGPLVFAKVLSIEELTEFKKPVRYVGLDCGEKETRYVICCLLYTSPSPRDRQKSRMPSSA